MPRKKSPLPASSDRQTAGRSADARGDTGTDADALASRAGSATGDTRMGGIPSTADSSLSPSMSGSSDITSDGPMDRERPAMREDESGSATPSPGTAPSAARGRRSERRHGNDERADVQPDDRRAIAPGAASAAGSTDASRPRDDGPLDSLGKAVSNSVLGAADEDPDAPPNPDDENKRDR